MKFNTNKESNNLDVILNRNLNKRLCNYWQNSNESKKLKKVNDKRVTERLESSLESIDNNRSRLPITSVRHKLIDAIKKSDSVVVIGETACGKSTQIPQYLYNANFVAKHTAHAMIGVTQPRRVAAISIAMRVANEMNCEVGSVVGYSVRFEDKTSVNTKIKYMTDGTLLREALSDPLLRRYKVLIIDEAHERTIQTDVLFAVIKKAHTMRNEKQMPILKVLVMSATMDVDHFSHYFNDAPVYYIIGRQYPIEIMYACNKQSDVINSALTTVFQIHQNEKEGDILVFCTGQEEIDNMIITVKETVPQLPIELQNLRAFPLYSALPNALQLNAFKRLPHGNRKVIFATNIAETSITIPNIKYVIDCGKVKSKLFNPSTGFEMLKVQNISKAQACQRSGRAGRESSGKCYRLYTKEDYDLLRDYAIPEIQRCNLANVLLHLIAIGINDVLKFDFMDSPSEQSIRNALRQLYELGAVQLNDDSNQLTELGSLMIKFPMEPRYSKAIITSRNMRCTEEIITILSLISVENIFYVPSAQRERALEIHKKFASSEGDLMKFLKVFREYKSAKENIQWCKENFIHIPNIKLANEIRKQLSDLCNELNIPLISCGNNGDIIRKCLTSGFMGSVAILQRDGYYKTSNTSQEVYIHPSSCLFGSKPECVIFNELIQTTKCYMRNVCVIDRDWLSK